MAKKKEPGFNEPKEVKVTGKLSTESYNEFFTLVNKDGEIMIAIGNGVISRKKFNSYKEAQEYIDSKPWDLIFNATAVLVSKITNTEIK